MYKSALMTLICSALLIGCSAPSGADSATEAPASYPDALPKLTGDYVWSIDTSKSTLSFQADYNGVFDAEFTRFDAVIDLNPDAPETGKIHAIVDLSSFKTGNDDVENNLPTAAWFNIKSHPSAIFISDTITKLPNGDFTAPGTMTLKGISKPAILMFSLNASENRAVADGRFTVNRTDYAVGTGSDFKDESWVKFPVEVSVHIEANR